MAPLSALFDCIVAGSPSIGPDPLMASSSSCVARTHAPIPIPFFTNTSEASMRVTCFSAVAKVAGFPLYLTGLVILSHVSLILILNLVPTSSVVASLMEIPLNVHEFF